MSSQQSGSKEILTTTNIVAETVDLLYGKYADGKTKKIGIETQIARFRASLVDFLSVTGGFIVKIIICYSFICSLHTLAEGKRIGLCFCS